MSFLTQVLAGFEKMLQVLVLLIVIAAGFYAAAFRRHDRSDKKALSLGWQALKNLLPLLILAFLAAGLIQVVIPPEIIRSWLGQEAGWKGILIASAAGMILPGGPYVAFPIISTIFEAGASLATAVTFITAWAVANINNIPYETALVSPRFTLARYAVVILMPPIAGLISQLIFMRLGL